MTLRRFADNPILSPNSENSWESKNVFNPAAIDIDGTVHILYRAMSEKNVSVFGYATSQDGLNIDYRHLDPAYTPRHDLELQKGGAEKNSGCEDPRITLIDDKLYIVYTAYNGAEKPSVAISSIKIDDFVKKDFNTWSYPVIVSPKGVDDKDGILFPEKFSEGYFFVHRIDGDICGDYIEDLSFSANEVNRCTDFISVRDIVPWESKKIGANTVSLIDEGWLLIYHGVSSEDAYRLGAVLLDKENPHRVLGRTKDPIFEPEMSYEKEGEVPNVVFPCGSVVRGDKIFVYYGAADRYVGVASASVKDLLSKIY